MLFGLVIGQLVLKQPGHGGAQRRPSMSSERARLPVLEAQGLDSLAEHLRTLQVGGSTNHGRSQRKQRSAAVKAGKRE